ncbi:hypothetical protein BO71DRAFT_432548 [Aspergillus ellipticus CBS 707.79]|uniref:Uncharacterized protein n=1 Tax=Aspergillus ellipticus CBS 707.79 TaxID=1448320 RepID=A0A319D3D3_9EURO|nr:hypothetical protein BO71DRAFT_432548 [Aspergillus ellipticus CBS 707.79]
MTPQKPSSYVSGSKSQIHDKGLTPNFPKAQPSLLTIPPDINNQRYISSNFFNKYPLTPPLISLSLPLPPIQNLQPLVPILQQKRNAPKSVCAPATTSPARAATSPLFSTQPSSCAKGPGYRNSHILAQGSRQNSSSNSPDANAGNSSSRLFTRISMIVRASSPIALWYFRMGSLNTVSGSIDGSGQMLRCSNGL